jgi:hypothetical protein
LRLTLKTASEGANWLIGLRVGQVADYWEHGNDPSGSMKGGGFLEYLTNYKLLKKNFFPWS